MDTALAPVAGKTLRIGVTGVWPVLRDQLAAIPGLTVEDFTPGVSYAAIIGSGLTDRSTPAQKLGGDAGLTLQRANGSVPVPGELPPEVLAAARTGTPLLVMAQEDGLADGVARQLAAEGAFTYESQVGKLRAPWMGNWYFLRTHPVYDGMPADQAMGLHFQAHGRQANGLVIDGAGVDVFVGYGRDHDRRVGAGTFTAKLGRGKLLFQRVPISPAPCSSDFCATPLRGFAHDGAAEPRHHGRVGRGDVHAQDQLAVRAHGNPACPPGRRLLPLHAVDRVEVQRPGGNAAHGGAGERRGRRSRRRPRRPRLDRKAISVLSA